jgi:hypothetical protein
MRRLLGIPLLASLLLASPAFAKDKGKSKSEEEEDDASAPVKVDESAFDEDEDDAAPAPTRIQEADSDDSGDAPDDLDFSDDGDDKDDVEFRDEDVQEAVKPRGPGEDSADIYRKAQDGARDMSIDEELLAWERYLTKYPKSLFRDRIEARVEELSAEMFNERVPGSDRGGTVRDAALRELNFANPIQFAPLDPRSRVSVGFEMGIPNWLAPRLDVEYALQRQLSVHGGVQRDGTNTSIAAGAKYALLKSARTNTLITGALDLKVYAAPSFVGLNPWVGVGQRFDVMEGLDVQAQFGLDAELRDPAGLRYNAGLAAELRASEIVSAYAETSMEFKYLGNDDFGTFRFMVASFGLRFRAAKARNDDGDGRLDVGLGANMPYSLNYWGFYRGAVSVDADYAL